MAHKTMVNGTVYEIDGGKTLIGGTAYSIDKGKTLVGGTAYEVGFAEMLKIKCEVTSDLGTEPVVFIEVNGTEYAIANNSIEIEVPTGTVMNIRYRNTNCPCEDFGVSCNTFVNGTSVNQTHEYSHTVDTPVTMKVEYDFDDYCYECDGKGYMCSCNITAVPEGYAAVALSNTSYNPQVAFSINGTQYSGVSVVVPIGTVVHCALTDTSGTKQPCVTVYGVEQSVDGIYDHIVTESVRITASRDSYYVSGTRHYTGYITITKM